MTFFAYRTWLGSLLAGTALLLVVAPRLTGCTVAETRPPKVCDTLGDELNCGACGHTCGAAESCIAGACVTDVSCESGQTVCGGSCVDVAKDSAHCGACDARCELGTACAGGTCLALPSNIKHVVLISQENHSFDSYLGKYCKAPAYSSPSCTAGPNCCEAAPALEPTGASPELLDDLNNAARDRNHAHACELDQIHGGLMDRFVVGSTYVHPPLLEQPCSTPHNWAVADAKSAAAYWAFADKGALADRYFQPIAGGSSSNDMYFVVARYRFTDNDLYPDSINSGCALPLPVKKISWKASITIGDVLLEHGKTFASYVQGYAAALESWKKAKVCPPPAADCPTATFPFTLACKYDAADVPFQYFKQFADVPAHMKDYDELATDLANGTLPEFVYIKAMAFANEHPGVANISRGMKFVADTVAQIEASKVADDTLILITMDEGGGFFDHVPPPPPVPTVYDADGDGMAVPYGTRVPTIALGRFAKKGFVSHVVLEHSSIVKFLELNFGGPGAVGVLGGRDGYVNNLGSLLDPKTTGLVIPDGP